MIDDRVATVKRLLPELTSRELREVIALAKIFLKTKPLEQIDSLDELLYQAIVEEIDTRLKSRCKPLSVILIERGVAFDRLLTASSKVKEWVDDAVQHHRLSRTQRKQLYTLCTGLVIEELQNVNIPVTVETVLMYFDRLPGIVDKAFPGYARSGLLHTVLLWKE